MKKTTKLLSLLLTFVIVTVMLASCVNNHGNNGDGNGTGDNGDTNDDGKIKLSSDTLYVDKVENMPEDFIMGMDASCVPALEASGVRYYDYDGTEKDVYEILSANGIN